MRKLPLLLVLSILALLGAALPAQASLLAQPAEVVPLIAPEDEADEAGEPADEEEGEVEEACETEEEGVCDAEDEESEEPGGKRKAKEDGCLLKGASAAVSVNPGKRRLRLSVHYRTWKPASVSIEAALHGVKGAVYLGTSHTYFRRSGVYRDTFELAEKQTKKALAAREVSVDLQVVNSPPACGLHLSEAVRRPKH
ncbi:MAG: hypothetical protein QOF06_2562 [Solirubrobacterales bacterium]|jgi:hypothetical protein|nr:hypothetical protein [Solirubrobacterales bacterium]